MSDDPGPKKKKSRKAHLKERAAKRKREGGSTPGTAEDRDYDPREEGGNDDEEIIENDVEVETAGGSSVREGAKQRQRLSRERLRGVSAAAGAMEAFLLTAAPTAFTLERARCKICVEVCVC